MIGKYLKVTLAGILLIGTLGLPGHAEAKSERHGHDHDGRRYERHWHNDDDDHQWRGRDHRHGWYGRDSRRDNDKVIIVIDSHDRNTIRNYRWDDRRDGCPPGLVRKKNGCTPPGHAKKYRIGERLPDYVVYYPIERDLRVRLSPLPVGYDYVRVDQDILLIGEAGKKVIDAVTLLSAVGN